MNVFNIQTPGVERGIFVVLEGIDGSGKTTLVKELSPLYESVTTRMPGGTPFAEELRGACRNADISDPAQILFYSALILDNHENVIRPAMDQDKLVISDRSLGSTFAYQAYPGGHEKLLLSILQAAKGIVVPDLTLYIDVSMENSLQREAAQDRVDVSDRYSRFGIIQKEKIKEAYDHMYIRQTRTNHLEQSFERDVSVWKIRERITKEIEVIDGNQPYEQVLHDCKTAIDKHIWKMISATV